MTNHEETNLPPKTCSVERLVTMESDVALVLQGKKLLHDVMVAMQM